MTRILRDIAFISLAIIAVGCGVLSFFNPVIFYSPVFAGICLGVAGLSLISAAFTRRPKLWLIHISSSILIVVLALYLNGNQPETITLGQGESARPKILPGYTLTLNSFTLPSMQINNYVSNITLSDNSNTKYNKEISVNHPIKVGNVLIYQYAFDTSNGLKTILLLNRNKFAKLLFFTGLVWLFALFTYLFTSKTKTATKTGNPGATDATS